MSRKKRDLIDKLKWSSLFRKETRDQTEDLEHIAAKERKLIPYRDLIAATGNFCNKNKLGHGGFGPVYKGTLKDGRVVAVKRLSATSKQGEKEFRNEVLLLSKVQHRNIVNLIGYCTTTTTGGGGDAEQLLVYEYMPRGSIDKLLFDKDKDKPLSLDWENRFRIIIGVAHGLRYLHGGCPTTIIHRDIKASNVLLDEECVPKIADLGMGRIYSENGTHVQTRIAGTNGYLPPEYLMHGHLSTKADIYSFGILAIELISGIKNSQFIFFDEANNLLAWAWKKHRRGQSLEILDGVLKDTAREEQVLSCLHVALLCTQDDPKRRPDMNDVIAMLWKKPSSLPEPARPGFSGYGFSRSSGSGITGSSGRTASSHASTSRSSGSGAATTSSSRASTSRSSGSSAATTSSSRASTSRSSGSSAATTSSSKSSHISASAHNHTPPSPANAMNRTPYRERYVTQ